MEHGATKGDVDDARRHSFALFYQRYLPIVHGQVRLFAQPDDVDEIVAATFVTAWLRYDEIPTDKQRAWLLQVARFQEKNKYRSQRRRAALVDAIVAARPAEETNMFVASLDSADVGPVLEVIRELAPDDQELLSLSLWHDLSPTEIAQVLGITPGAARVRLHRVRRRFEVEYRRRVGGELAGADADEAGDVA